jgi:DNA-binding transcriptional MerR regulator
MTEMNYYTIKEVSQLLGIPTSTLRYYDSEGLLPLLARKESGYRIFSSDDITMLKIIECLKKTGMEIKDIRKFADMVREGDASLEERLDMFMKQRLIALQKLEDAQETLDNIDRKIWYYQESIAAGTEEGFKGLPLEQYGLYCENKPLRKRRK